MLNPSQYANQQGCDGEGRLYFDGCSSVVVSGDILSQGKQFSLSDVEVVTATVDLDEIRARRFEPSRRMQAVGVPLYPRIQLDARLGHKSEEIHPELKPTEPRKLRIHDPEEEIALGPACWYGYLHLNMLYMADAEVGSGIISDAASKQATLFL